MDDMDAGLPATSCGPHLKVLPPLYETSIILNLECSQNELFRAEGNFVFSLSSLYPSNCDKNAVRLFIKGCQQNLKVSQKVN